MEACTTWKITLTCVSTLEISGRSPVHNILNGELLPRKTNTPIRSKGCTLCLWEGLPQSDSKKTKSPRPRNEDILWGLQCAVFVDSGPVMEREWGKRSGLGWIGKNTLLLSKGKDPTFSWQKLFAT